MHKKIFAIFLAVLTVFISLSTSIYAQPSYTANLSISYKDHNKFLSPGIIYVYPGEIVELYLNLKTSDNFFAGPFASQVFYSAKSFDNIDITLNTSGKFYSCCKTYTNLTLFNDLSDSAKNRLYPTNWGSDTRRNYEFFNLNMIPTAADCTVTPSGLDEDLLKVTVSVGKNLSAGTDCEIFIAQQNVRSAQNITGSTYLSCYKDKGSLSGERYDYGDDISFDTSLARLTFKITNVGDVNADGKISSLDALMALQAACGIVILDKSQSTRADTNCDGKVNASDALSILQISTGLAKINNFLNK